MATIDSSADLARELIEYIDAPQNFVDIFNHLNKVELMSEDLIEKNKNVIENDGQRIYDKYAEFHDLANVMEHPEFFSFYLKYMKNPYHLKQMLVLMKMYHLISQYLSEKDLTEEHHNAYHKLAILHKILSHPSYSRILLKKVMQMPPHNTLKEIQN